MLRRDARRIPSAQVFYEKILRFAAGGSVECMALAVVTGLEKRTPPLGTGCGRENGLSRGGRSVSWRGTEVFDRLNGRAVRQLLNLSI